MKIKVCGLRHPENIDAVAATLQPDYMGFIFYAPSPRYARRTCCRNIASIFPKIPFMKTGSFFVNEDAEAIG